MPTIRVFSHWLCRLVLLLVVATLWAAGVRAETRDLSPDSLYWVDPGGQADIQAVSRLPAQTLQSNEPSRSSRPGDQGALWVRLTLPELNPDQQWYIVLDGATPAEQARAYQSDGAGGWRIQQAGDHVPINEWSTPDRRPLFKLSPGSKLPEVWLRLVNHPTPLNLRTTLVDENQLQQERSWTFLLVGSYLGFGLLVLFLGWVHARLYSDRAFVAYMAYVASMLGFQAAFTGVGGLFFWPGSATWTNAAPSVFMFWLTGSGIWFVSEVCALSRHHPALNRFIQVWAVFGLLYPGACLYLDSALALGILNTYGLLSLLLSLVVCVWTWRQGDRYAGWLVLAFIPVQLGYCFLALRAVGLTPDTWAAQYAVLIGSSIEIPVLLYILHLRAKEFTENRARMRALDSTDPLTGLPVKLIFDLRLEDAIRRSRRFRHHSGLLLVELVNHADIGARLGQTTGDRALVVAAARLSQVVRDVDTVCRVRTHRFALLIEGPQKLEHLKLLAQHIVAKGLEPGSALPEDTSLRFRVALTMLPAIREIGAEEDERSEAQRLKGQLHKALDQRPEGGHKPVIILAEAV